MAGAHLSAHTLSDTLTATTPRAFQESLEVNERRVTPIIHVLLFGLTLGYAFNCAFALSMAELTLADEHIRHSVAGHDGEHH